MNLEHLRIFTYAAELGSFTKAAGALGLAQPTVSRIISELEEEWGGPLFYRTGRGATLSELGQEALGKAQALLRDFEQVSEDLRAFGRLPNGNVSIGLPPSLIPSVLPDLLNQLLRDRPGIRLRVYEGFSEQIERWLSDGTLDLGIVSKYGTDDKPHEHPPKGGALMMSSRLVLAGRAAGWTLPPEIDFPELAGVPLVLPAIPNGLRMVVEVVAKRMKLKLSIVAEVDSILAQRELALNCGCYILKAPHTFVVEEREGLLASSVLRNPCFNRHAVLMTGQQPLSRASRDVAARVTSILRGLSRR